jgi:hypothetical protein
MKSDRLTATQFFLQKQNQLIQQNESLGYIQQLIQQNEQFEKENLLLKNELDRLTQKMENDDVAAMEQ